MNFLEMINLRLNIENRNWLAIICGDTGSGKSYSALKLGELISGKRFNINNVVFDSISFMKLLNEGNLIRGDTIIFDEAGIGFDSRNWMNNANKLLSYVLQSMRHRNLATIFTTPNIKFADISGRRLFHTYMETIRIDRARNETILKVFWCQSNPLLGKVYHKKYRFQSGDTIFGLQNLALSLPTDKIIEDYETKKNTFTKELGQRIELELITAKEKAERKPLDLEKIIRTLRKDYRKYVGKHRGSGFYLDKILIKGDYPELSHRQVLLVKKTLENELSSGHTHAPVVN